MTAPSRSTAILRPLLRRAPRTARAKAACIGALARTIEFFETVLHRIALPVQTVPPSLVRDGPVIFVANHRSLLDTPFLRWSMPRSIRRQLVTVGGYDFFEPRGAGPRRWIAAAVLQFIVHGYRVWMIDRRVEGAAHLPALASLLEDRWSLLLYPEGRRSRSGCMGPMAPGAALLSIRTGAAIVPMFISGTERVLGPGVAWPRHAPVHIRAGAPMTALPGEHADALMRRVRAAIEGLAEQHAQRASMTIARGIAGITGHSGDSGHADRAGRAARTANAASRSAHAGTRGARWLPRWNIGKAIESALFALLLIPLARHTPWLSRAIRPLFVWATWLALPGRRRSLRRTARIVLAPEATAHDCDRHGRRVLSNIQAFIADVATIDRRSVEEMAAPIDRMEGLEHLMRLLDARSPVILAGAHIGSFESSVAALRTVSRVPVHVVFSRDALRAFDRVRSRAREHLGIIEQPVERGLETWIALREALARGEVVAILADRVVPGQRGVVVPLLGFPAELPTGPLRLAAATAAPIVPTFALPRADGRTTLRFEPAIRVPDDGGTNDPDHPALRTLVRSIECAIRTAPEHWLVVDGPWIHDRGVTTPFDRMQLKPQHERASSVSPRPL